MNDWKQVWERHSADKKILDSEDFKKIVLELKRSNGFDVIGNGLEYQAIIDQCRHFLRKLSMNDTISLSSVYEVGCGSGANLYVFEHDGIKCGGIDYSDSLLIGAQKILETQDLTCGEAKDMSIQLKYDAILSNGVFGYFVDEEYAELVLEKMYEKTGFSLGITDIPDVDKKEAFLKYRREMISDYDIRYANLPKLFYSKELFKKFAQSHGLEIEFEQYMMPGYWNSEFCYDCYMYKK